MTASDLELPKGPFFANDNFQEFQTDFPDRDASENLRISADFLSKPDTPRHRPIPACSSMVSGVGGATHPAGTEARSPEPGKFTNWTRKHKVGRRKVTRQLTLAQVRDLKSAWHHAGVIGRPMNRFVTFRPRNINEQDPQQRIETWTAFRNKLAQFARDNDFDFTSLWTRESKRETGQDEHLHLLMNVPQRLVKKFDKVVRAWSPHADEIDVRGSTYQIRRNKKGGEESVITYVAKNSPQAGRYLNHTIQLGGPIFGKRCGLSANLTARARARYEVTGGLRRDLRLVKVTADMTNAGCPANDGPHAERHRAA